TAEPGEIVVPMRLTNRRPAVEIALGSGSAWFLMDTGAPSDLVLSEERARALGIEFDPVASVTFRNLYGDARAALTRLERVEVGGHAIDGPTLAVALREGSSYRVTNVAGADQALLGNAFLRRFRVRFDYPNRRVGLLPLASPPPSGDAEPLQASLAPAPGEVVPELELPEVASLEPARALVPTEEVFLEVKAPEAGVREEFVPWVEVEGWAGVHRSRAYDVAIVIDTSGSTAWASGIDVDEDGRVGRGRRRVDLWRSFNPRHMCSDPGDTVLAAELVATRRLVDALDPERTRIGLVTFSDGSRLNASVGSDRETFSELLDQLGEGFSSGYTNFAAAIRLATEALVAASEGEPDAPQRVILFLSDGYPTFPGSEERAAREALEAAREAAASSVRIHTFGLGLADDPNAPESEDEDAFVQMAALTGGSHLRLDTPGEVVQELPRIDLAEVAGVEIVNATSGQSARATRVFPDGSFDAFVSLVPGENVIRVTARGARGGVARAERRIVFDRREPATPEEAAALEARVRELEVELRARAVETELYLQMGRQRQQKALELELEPPAGDP
nr:VWA domain-containing protein [Myxococcota bacterium]